MKTKRIIFNSPADYEEFYNQFAELLAERERLIREAKEREKCADAPLDTLCRMH